MSTRASNRALRLALIGLGRWGKIILRALEEVPDVQVAVVASSKAEAPRLVPPGCTVDPSWRAVVCSPIVDAVLVATPAALHAEMALAALAAHKPVFLEKPLALTPSDARRVAARAVGGILAVDHLDLDNPAWGALKGELSLVGGVVRIEGAFGTFDGRVDVSPLWDWGPHAVALCVDLVGLPHAAALSPDGTLDLRFPGGCRAEVTLGNRLPGRARRLVVVCERGTLTYDDNADVKVKLRTGGTERAIPYGSERPLSVALERFVSRVREGTPWFGEADFGVHVVDVLAEASSRAELKG
jgi:predicted dehydrogenase